MSTTLTRRDEALADVFATALEGGIGYWSQATVYRWSDGEPHHNQIRDFHATILDIQDVNDDGTNPVYVIDRKVIALGITRLFTYLGGGRREGYQWQAAKDLYFGRYDDADYDADTADMIVQLGLFNEVRYG